MKLLIVEDQENLAKMLQRGLISEGFTADIILDGKTAFNRLQMHHSEYDLVVLDFMLPQKSGLDICTQLRELGICVPIIMLTAKDDKKDITNCLNAGADDYLTKPFSFEELIARIRAILRRPKVSLPTKLTAGKIVLDCDAKSAICSGKQVHLTLKEFALLEYLMRQPGVAMSRDQLLSGAWDFAFDSFANVVDVHITNLRKKLDDREGKIIETVRGVGYKINN